MRSLVICRPAAGVTLDQIAALGRAEMDALRSLRDRGVLLEAYSPGGPGAILIFASDSDEVAEAVETLPLREAGLIETELIPLRPFDLG